MSESTDSREGITKDDIQAKFAELKGSLDGTADSARTPLLATGAVVMAALVALAFLLGRRRGRSSRTVVEIRRV